jgi:hypothetical protein
MDTLILVISILFKFMGFSIEWFTNLFILFAIMQWHWPQIRSKIFTFAVLIGATQWLIDLLFGKQFIIMLSTLLFALLTILYVRKGFDWITPLILILFIVFIVTTEQITIVLLYLLNVIDITTQSFRENIKVWIAASVIIWSIKIMIGSIILKFNFKFYRETRK